MDLKKLEEFIELAKKYEVGKLEYKSGDESYKVDLQAEKIIAGAAASLPQMTTASVAATTSSSAPEVSANTSGLVEVTSPFVGTFYRSPSPEDPAYAKTGDSVSPGKVLCIVEAMKIMNEIESEVSGEIVEICVENETYVEFGQVLFRVKPN